MDTINIFKTDLRNKVRILVPFIEGAWVEFYDDTTVGAVQRAQKAKASSDILDNLGIIIGQIADWNFANENGKLPITAETLADERLPLKIITWLSEQQAKILTPKQTEAEDKKKISS